jgi:methionine--tRNA ligase beta chain
LAGKVPFEDFVKLDCRVGRIVEAEMVPGARKLVRLKIDIGGVLRQSVAGLGEQYSPEDLRSKLVAVVTNLQPRKIFGQESEVMLLAALDGDTVSLLRPDRDVSAGSKIA